MTHMTQVATLALPVVVKDFGNGEFGYEIGLSGSTPRDIGFGSFDAAEGAARNAASEYEVEMSERYNGIRVAGAPNPESEATWSTDTANRFSGFLEQFDDLSGPSKRAAVAFLVGVLAAKWEEADGANEETAVMLALDSAFAALEDPEVMSAGE